MSTDTKLFHFREFLNEGRGAAMVEATVTHTEYERRGTDERTWHVDGTLHLTDCSRSVEIDASFSDIEGARNLTRKLDRIIDAAQGMRDAVVRCARREWPGRKL